MANKNTAPGAGAINSRYPLSLTLFILLPAIAACSVLQAQNEPTRRGDDRLIWSTDHAEASLRANLGESALQAAATTSTAVLFASKNVDDSAKRQAIFNGTRTGLAWAKANGRKTTTKDYAALEHALADVVSSASPLHSVGLSRVQQLEFVDVFYATDRKRDENVSTHISYGGDPGPLEMGTARVTFPPYQDHKKGRLERPSLLRLQWSEDPKKHVVIMDIKSMTSDSFFAALQQQVEDPSLQHEVFVFVHGYRVKFEDAVRKTAQLHYDLEFQGVPVLFSWPSQGLLLGYWADEETVQLSAPHLKHFLLEVRERTNATAIHVIGHSMGSRVITAALTELARERADIMPIFDQLVFAAPDVYRDLFSELAEELKTTARRITLYASSQDKALWLSRWFHWHSRAGESGENVLVLPGIDTVDVSEVDTDFLEHSYYGDNRSIITDLHTLLHEKKSPPRFGLKPITSEQPLYWFFHP